MSDLTEVPNQRKETSEDSNSLPEEPEREEMPIPEEPGVKDTAPLHLDRMPELPPPFGSKSLASSITPPEKNLLDSSGETIDLANRLKSSDSETKPLYNREKGEEKTPPTSTHVPIPSSQSLPRRVSEVDAGSTRVSASAYATSQAGSSRRDSKNNTRGAHPNLPRQGSSTQTTSRSQLARVNRPNLKPSPSSSTTPKVVRPTRQAFDGSGILGCLLRLGFASLFALFSIFLCIFSILFYQYYRVAASLPDINDLRQRSSQFETTRIFDREGNVLYEILDPNAGRRTYVPLEKISPFTVAATIATEDKGFYSHPGFDPFAILRGFWQNYQSGEIVSGASTITQQLARTVLFTPEERSESSYDRKIREAILATEITRRYSKDEILEIYLNEIYFGNLAYGVEAASETYFGIAADKLTLGQASFLAGLPQAPAVYDVYSNPEATFGRHRDVLVLMYELSQDQDCIEVSNSPQAICVDPVSVTTASEEIKDYPFKSPDIKMRFPHWVTYIRSLLEAQYDPQTIYRSGFSVYTTLDPTLQDLAQAAVSEQVTALAAHNTKDGALIAIRPTTGEILSMVGSPDFSNEAISGQVNMAINPRQPGSSIKPLTYLAALEKGWTLATLIWDVPSEFPASGRADDTGPTYKPVNYDNNFHGQVLVRAALANSYNIPAVKTLQFVGIYDDPNTPNQEGLISFARRMGITTLNRSDYGLSLTLGGGEVSLLEMTSAYATMANNGLRVSPYAISRILDHEGNVVFEYQQPVGEQVTRAEHAYLISSVLSDNQARTPAFGANSVLNLPFPAAAKTGTSNDFRDNWTLGYTPDIAVGVWVGNSDYTPMQDTSGLVGAAPIWARVMQAAVDHLTSGNPMPFIRPPGVVEKVVCDLSGTIPSQWCPKQLTELFAIDQPPLPEEDDLWQKIAIDTWTGLGASPTCAEYTDEKFVLNVTDQWAKKWIKKDPQGKSWVEGIGFPKPVVFTPSRECTAEDPHPNLQFAFPRNGETIRESPLGIYAIIDSNPKFEFWRLDFGMGEKPVDWQVLEEGQNRIPQPELLHNWDLVGFPAGIITLRLYMQGPEDAYAEKRIHLNMEVPTPTLTPTPTWTSTPTPTLTPLPTETSTLSPTETPTETPISPEAQKFPKATTSVPF
jgi:penicillin-binding protein 1C